MLHGLPQILIVRLSAIGDVVRVLPALEVLRHAFPNAQIDWAVEPRAESVISGHPHLDEVLVFERGESSRRSVGDFFKFCRLIRSRRYDMVFDFHGILKSGLIARYSGAADRYGFSRGRARELSWLASNHRKRLGRVVLTRMEENLRLCELAAPRMEVTEFPCHVPHEVQGEVEEYFEASFPGGKWVVAMHVGMDRPEKRWPVEHFAALSDMLLADGRFDVVLTWGPGQADQGKAVLDLARRKPGVAPEMPSLKHYMWLVRCAHLYFGGDTGPMHIASAMGTPVVAVFGGTDPARHEPMREPFEVLTGPADSGKGFDKRNGARRLDAITPEAAYDSCVRVALAAREAG